MGDAPFELLVKTIFAAAALSCPAACASADTPQPPRTSVAADAHADTGGARRFMVLGGPAAPPTGYLDFCARRPDQCDVDHAIGADTEALSVRELKRVLYARYYWPVVYGGRAETSAQPLAAGQERAAASAATPAASASADADAVSAIAPGSDRSGSDRLVGFRAARSTSLPPLAQSDGAPSLILIADSDDDAADARSPLLQGAWRSQARSSPDDRFQAAGGGLSDDADARFAPPDNPPEASAASPPWGDRVAYTPALARMLEDVDLRINRSIRYVQDMSQYGRENYWTLPLDAGGSGAGDCKDYVLEKRRALIALGVPSGALSIAIVKTMWGESHAVLLVSTDQGELVLDSLSSRVQPWTKVHYAWIERQTPGQELIWVKIGA